MPRPKKMKNNASSVSKDKELLNIINDDQNSIVSKHNQLRNQYLTINASGEPRGDNDTAIKTSQGILSESRKYQRQFTINKEIIKLFEKSNYPTRFPIKLESETSCGNVVIQENKEKLVPVLSSAVKMTKLYINFWNKVISKQDSVLRSSLEHQVTDSEAGYFPCQLKYLFNSPESYLKKSYCERGRFSGPGYQFLPSNNKFVKISSRSIAKLELERIFDYFYNTLNHYFLIPIEMSSKLSRSMFKSNEISQKSNGCNKINYICQLKQNFNKNCHPLFTIDYKSSIELEYLPCNEMSLMDNYENGENSDKTEQKSAFQKIFFNYTYLSHFLYRSDFWIDDFYARCWHYSRFFCDKLDLGNRINSTANILIRDSLFKYFLACSARICIAIKYWILNPEGATYFRCWCGQRVFDLKKENKILKKLPIGSADLYNFQQKIIKTDIYHRKHNEKKIYHHICVCKQQFNDHKSWISHIFSTKISEIDKICPVFIYFFAKNSVEDGHYTCQCTQRFVDYDFWSFWLHTCNCPSLINNLKNFCICNTSNTSTKTSHQRRNRGLRKRVSKNIRSHKNEEDKIKKRKNSNQEEDQEDSATWIMEDDKCKGTVEEDSWQAADKLDSTQKASEQINYNNYHLKLMCRNSDK